MRTFKIHTELAQQIVDSVKAVVERDINFIDCNGRIIASTDAKRIGDFHEAGYQVIKETNSKKVMEDNEFSGTKKGMNYPIYFDDKVVAVIGITGDPKEVSRFGFLVTKISEIFLKEYGMELDLQHQNQKMERFVNALIYQDAEGIEELSASFPIQENIKYAAVRFFIQKETDSSRLDQTRQSIINLCRRLDGLYSYIYPREIVLILKEMQIPVLKKSLIRIEKEKIPAYTTGIGTCESINFIHLSYHFAKLAAAAALADLAFFQCAEDMNLLFLLESLEPKIKERYCKKIATGLSKEDMGLLKIYFEQNLSLKLTAEVLHIHKNTLQYRLNQIEEKTKRSPRKFKTAVELYLAVSILTKDNHALPFDPC